MKKQILLIAFVTMSIVANAQWQLTGNAGTNPLANFIGTTDTLPLKFRVSNTGSGYIDFIDLNTAFGYQSGSNFFLTGNHNTFYGAKSGISNSSGTDNTYIGHQAGNNATSGIGNTCVGGGAGALLTTGLANTAIGSNAGGGNLSGSGNTFLGYASQASVSNLANATAVGYLATVSASNSIVLGNNANVGIGVSAPLDKLHVVGNIRMVDGNQANGKVLTSDANGTASWQAAGWNTTGNAGTNPSTNFIGTKDNVQLSFRVNDTLAGNINHSFRNVFLGYKAGLATTVGSGNTFIGDRAGMSNTSINNTFIGKESGTLNTSGVQSVYIGAFAGTSNTTGNQNAYLGFNSGKASNGNANTFLGESAAIAHISGDNNVMIGKSAAGSLTTGTDNVIIGSTAASSLTSGSSNTVIGEGTLTGSTRTNGIVIGNGAVVTLDNCAVIGNSSVTKIGIGKTPSAANILEFQVTTAKLTTGGVWTNASDRKLKDNITQLDKNEILEKINNLEVARWHYKADKEMKTYIGPFAKEFYDAFKTGDESTISTIDPSGVALIGIQALSRKNEELAAEIEKLKSQLANQVSAANDGMVRIAAGSEENVSLLGQNLPNPFDNSTIIPFRIPKECHSAAIIISESTGKIVRAIPVSCRETQLSLEAGTLAPSVYSYSLVVDGKTVETRQMILTK